MKIGYVLVDAQVTGGQIVALSLARGALEAGHRAVAIFPREGPMVERFTREGIETRVMPLTRSFRLDEAIVLARSLREERIDIVDTHTLFVGNQLTRLAAARARIPMVAHLHIPELFHGRAWVRQLQDRLNRWTLRTSAAVIAVSSQLGEAAIAAGVERGKVHVVHNGVELGEAAPPTRTSELRLVCAARLAPVKGQALLLHALSHVDDVQVDFVGDDLELGGLYRQELAMLAAELGLAERVRFLGRRADLPDLLRRADALVLPSFAEGLPLVVLEAMAIARPVIATAVGGTPEAVVDGVTGLLVPPNDIPALVSALTQMRLSPGLAAQYGAAGRERVASSFTTARMVAQTLAVYEKALNRPFAPESTC